MPTPILTTKLNIPSLRRKLVPAHGCWSASTWASIAG